MHKSIIKIGSHNQPIYASFSFIKRGWKIFFFFFLIGPPSFTAMIRPIGKTPIHLSMEEVAVHIGHKFLMESDDNSALVIQLETTV